MPRLRLKRDDGQGQRDQGAGTTAKAMEKRRREILAELHQANALANQRGGGLAGYLKRLMAEANAAVGGPAGGVKTKTVGQSPARPAGPAGGGTAGQRAAGEPGGRAGGRGIPGVSPGHPPTITGKTGGQSPARPARPGGGDRPQERPRRRLTAAEIAALQRGRVRGGVRWPTMQELVAQSPALARFIPVAHGGPAITSRGSPRADAGPAIPSPALQRGPATPGLPSTALQWLPELPTLAQAPSWCNKAGHVDRSACLAIRVRDVKRLAVWEAAQTATGRSLRGVAEVMAADLDEVMRRLPPRMLIGDFRPQARAMQPGRGWDRKWRQKGKCLWNTGRMGKDIFGLRAVDHGLPPNPNFGACREKVLGLGAEWYHRIHLECWETPGKRVKPAKGRGGGLEVYRLFVMVCPGRGMGRGGGEAPHPPSGGPLPRGEGAEDPHPYPLPQPPEMGEGVREAPLGVRAVGRDRQRTNRDEYPSAVNALYPYHRTWHQPCRADVTRRVRLLFFPLATEAEARDAAAAQGWLAEYRRWNPNAPGTALEAGLVARYGLLFHPRVPLCEHCLKLKRGCVNGAARRARGIPARATIDMAALGLFPYPRNRLGRQAALPFVKKKRRQSIRLLPEGHALPVRRGMRGQRLPMWASFREVRRVPAETLPARVPGVFTGKDRRRMKLVKAPGESGAGGAVAGRVARAGPKRASG